MEVRTVKEVTPDNLPHIVMRILFDENVIEGGRASFGVVTIPPGVRVPIEGTGSHEGDEYSIVLKGSIITMSGGSEYRVSSGQTTFIPAGEEHWAFNDGEEECEIVWVLVKR